jgi:hypothetical protein
MQRQTNHSTESVDSGAGAENQTQLDEDWTVVAVASQPNGFIVRETVGDDPRIAAGNETRVPLPSFRPMAALKVVLEGLRDGQAVSCGQVGQGGPIRHVAGRPALMLAICRLSALPRGLQLQVRLAGPQGLLTRSVPQLGSQAGLLVRATPNDEYHLCMLVADGADIPRCAGLVRGKQIAADFYYTDEKGAVQTPIEIVPPWQPICEPAGTQTRMLLERAPFDTRMLPDLTSDERKKVGAVEAQQQNGIAIGIGIGIGIQAPSPAEQHSKLDALDRRIKQRGTQKVKQKPSLPPALDAKIETPVPHTGAPADAEAGDLPVLVTHFRDESGSWKRETAYTLSRLCQRIFAADAVAKEDLWWLKLARFGDKPSGKGSLRYDANVIGCTGCEADYDGKMVTFEAAVELLRKHRILAIVYTSPSYAKAAPKWRVLCFFSQELSPHERTRMLDRVAGLFKDIDVEFAPESWALSQAYYFGRVNGNPDHQVKLSAGTPIDLHDDLDEIGRAFRAAHKNHLQSRCATTRRRKNSKSSCGTPAPTRSPLSTICLPNYANDSKKRSSRTPVSGSIGSMPIRLTTAHSTGHFPAPSSGPVSYPLRSPSSCSRSSTVRRAASMPTPPMPACVPRRERQHGRKSRRGRERSQVKTKGRQERRRRDRYRRSCSVPAKRISPPMRPRKPWRRSSGNTQSCSAAEC